MSKIDKYVAERSKNNPDFAKLVGQEKQFRVELLPNLYLVVIIENGKESLDLEEKIKNMNFSDLRGPEFIQFFNKSYYQELQKEYSDYLPKFNQNDKLFVFEEENSWFMQ